MILDMNLKIEGINEEFLDELDELIEETRVEYFIINPKTKEELQKAQDLAILNQRFKYTMYPQFLSLKDDNCVAFNILKPEDLHIIDDMPIVIESEILDDNFIEVLNDNSVKGVVLNSKEKDVSLKNFAFSISHNTLKNWSKEVIYETDYNKIALQSDYPNFSYDELVDGLLKEISDLTFRAEQTIAAGGTRTILKTFKML